MQQSNESTKQSLVSLKDITKSFGKQSVLCGLSLEFNHTGLYIIKGPSGSGKTTLLRIIAGLDNDFTGEVTGAGISNCSYAFQEHRLFPAASAFDNVFAVTRGSDSERTKCAMDALISVGFDPEDFEKLPSELSGGMKQRVSLARAIAADKPILLLDEPTKELDQALRSKLQKLFIELSKKKLIIAVTHLEDDITALSDKIIDLSQVQSAN